MTPEKTDEVAKTDKDERKTSISIYIRQLIKSGIKKRPSVVCSFRPAGWYLVYLLYFYNKDILLVKMQSENPQKITVRNRTGKPVATALIR